MMLSLTHPSPGYTRGPRMPGSQVYPVSAFSGTRVPENSRVYPGPWYTHGRYITALEILITKGRGPGGGEIRATTHSQQRFQPQNHSNPTCCASWPSGGLRVLAGGPRSRVSGGGTHYYRANASNNGCRCFLSRGLAGACVPRRVLEVDQSCRRSIQRGPRTATRPGVAWGGGGERLYKPM